MSVLTIHVSRKVRKGLQKARFYYFLCELGEKYRLSYTRRRLVQTYCAVRNLNLIPHPSDFENSGQ